MYSEADELDEPQKNVPDSGEGFEVVRGQLPWGARIPYVLSHTIRIDDHQQRGRTGAR